MLFRRYLPLLLFAVVLVTSGCNAPFGPFWGDDYHKLDVSSERLRRISPVVLEEQSLSEPRTVEEAASARLNGWTPRSMRDEQETIELTLADVRAAALANNLDLQVVLYDPAVAEAVVREEAARFEWTFVSSIRHSEREMPTASQLTSSELTNTDIDFGVRIPLYTGGTVNVNVPMNRTKTNNIFSTLDPAYTSDFSFSISQPLLRDAGLRVNTHGIRVARYQQQATDSRTKLEAIRILAAADRAYWRVYTARQVLKVRMSEYELADRLLRRATRRVEVGEDAEIEVIRAEAGLAERLEAIIVAENAMRLQQRELKRIVNISGLGIGSTTQIVPMSKPSPLGLELDAESLASHALETRMEMLEIELQLAIDASTVDLQRNRALPLFTVDYQYHINGLGTGWDRSYSMLRKRDFDGWQIGLNAEIPLGNEAARARVHQAILTRLQRLATREQRELAIRQEVFDAVDQLDSTWQRILAARQAAILAGRRLQGEQRQFDVGVRTSTDVLDAAAALADSQLAEIRALADYQIAMIDIAFATGTLLGRAEIDWQPHNMPTIRR